MIVLPPHPSRRAGLASFWLVVSLMGAGVTGALLGLLVSPVWVVAGFLLAPVLALPGLLRPRWASLPYRVWNKLARMYARGARLALMAICFYIILPAVGWTGSALRLAPPRAGASLWVPRHTTGPGALDNSSWSLLQEEPGRGWIRALSSWVVASRNWWTYGLFPFFMALSALDVELPEEDVPTNIYTLF